VSMDFDFDVTLSLFDGISCGQEALKQAGISTRIFLASEIEKYPKMITRKNHPLTIQLGDVKNVVADDLPHVNLLMGGSPCQGFSFAGKQLNFDDPRSALFFEFVRLLKECKPDYFLLENVKMKQEYQDIISEHLGVEPVMINSALVSAQSRKRLYWTNIPGVGQPDDLQINLINVLENNVDDSISNKRQKIVDKNLGDKLNQDHLVIGSSQKNAYIGKDKCSTLTQAMASGGGQIPMIKITQPKDKGIVLKDILEESPEDYTLMSDKFVNRNKDAGCLIDSDKPKASNLSAMEYVKNGRQSDYIKSDKKGRPCELKDFNKNALCHHAATAIDVNGHDSLKRVYADSGKSPTLNTMGGGNTHPKVLIVPEKVKVRKHEVDIPVLCGRIVGRKINPETGKRDDYNPDLKAEQRIEPRLDEKSGTLTTVQKDNVVVTHPTYRKLTPKECERLQTLPDNYTKGVSNTQRYKALGNGWTVDVIVHLLQGLKQKVAA